MPPDSGPGELGRIRRLRGKNRKAAREGPRVPPDTVSGDLRGSGGSAGPAGRIPNRRSRSGHLHKVAFRGWGLQECLLTPVLAKCGGSGGSAGRITNRRSRFGHPHNIGPRGEASSDPGEGLRVPPDTVSGESDKFGGSAGFRRKNPRPAFSLGASLQNRPQARGQECVVVNRPVILTIAIDARHTHLFFFILFLFLYMCIYLYDHYNYIHTYTCTYTDT